MPSPLDAAMKSVAVPMMQPPSISMMPFDISQSTYGMPQGGFALPISPQAHVLPAPQPHPPHGGAPLDTSRFMQGYGAAQAIDTARQEVARIPGAPPAVPLDYAERVSLMLNPQLTQFYLGRAELQRRQAAGSQIQKGMQAVHDLVRERKFDEAQKTWSQAVQYSTLAPEFNEHLVRTQDFIFKQRVSAGVRMAVEQHLDSFLKNAPSPNKNLVAISGMLKNPTIPDESIAQYIDKIAESLSGTMSREEWTVLGVLRSGIRWQPGRGEMEQFPVTQMAFSTENLSPEQRMILHTRFGISEADLERLSTIPGFDLGPILRELGASAEQLRHYREKVRVAPMQTPESAAPLRPLGTQQPTPSQTSQTVLEGQIQQQEAAAEAAKRGEYHAKYNIAPLIDAFPGSIPYTRDLEKRPDLIHHSFNALKDRGLLIFNAEQQKAIDPIRRAKDALLGLREMFASIADVKQSISSSMVGGILTDLRRSVPILDHILTPAHPTDTVEDVAKQAVNTFVLDTVFSDNARLVGAIRRSLDAGVFSDKRTADQALEQLESLVLDLQTNIIGSLEQFGVPPPTLEEQRSQEAIPSVLPPSPKGRRRHRVPTAVPQIIPQPVPGEPTPGTPFVPSPIPGEPQERRKPPIIERVP